MSAFPFAWRRPGLALAWGGVAVSVALAPLLADAPLWVLLLPWTLSAVALGLPHGAADPVVPFRMGGAALRPGPLAAFCVAYLAVGAAVLGVWAALPTAAALGFLALTWAHWGQGDLYALRALGWDRHLGGRAHLALALVVRGALPMAVPLAAFPEVYAETVGAMAATFRPDRAEAARAAVLGVSRPALALGLAGLFAAYAAWGALVARRAGRMGAGRPGAVRTLALDVGEVAALAAFFAVVPPVWSVGVYFCLWHALRHLQRLAPLVAGGSAARLALVSTPATVGALVLIGALAVGAGRGGRPLAELGVYLVGIAALTVPHVLVVAWMDARQRVWG